jgi:hypothetical protein
MLLLAPYRGQIWAIARALFIVTVVRRSGGGFLPTVCRRVVGKYTFDAVKVLVIKSKYLLSLVNYGDPYDQLPLFVILCSFLLHCRDNRALNLLGSSHQLRLKALRQKVQHSTFEEIFD